MSYQIIYEKRKGKKHGRNGALLFMTILAWLIFFQLVNARWPEGQAVIERFLGHENVVSTFNAFASELQTGSEFWTVFQEFCEHVIQNLD